MFRGRKFDPFEITIQFNPMTTDVLKRNIPARLYEMSGLKDPFDRKAVRSCWERGLISIDPLAETEMQYDIEETKRKHDRALITRAARNAKRK